MRFLIFICIGLISFALIPPKQIPPPKPPKHLEPYKPPKIQLPNPDGRPPDQPPAYPPKK
ncbi:MAG: hypothetical protein IJ575_01855 [Selenomonadaceae bacterium]|nr:hypothetical protein [Selenomonadaceae bacterium]